MTELRSEADLFSEFAPVTAQAWRTRIEADLKGADYEKTLTRLTDEGIRIQPFYTAEDQSATMPALSELRAEKGWRNCPSIVVENVAQATEQLKTQLPGAEAICLKIPAGSAPELTELLRILPLAQLPVILEIQQAPLHLIEQLKQAAEQQSVPLTSLIGALEFDPLGSLSPSGSYNEAELAELAALQAEMPQLKLLSVNGAYFHNQGGTAVQELAFTLSAAVEYLHRLTDDGTDLTNALGAFSFRLAVGTEYFLEIAKLRALRLLWKAIVLEFKGTTEQAALLKVHSVTSEWHQTLLDPHTNLLRTTTEAMSATIGGCDYLTVRPYDEISRPGGTEFSQRIARNISIILKEEAYLEKTVDPAAGSYFIEHLTQELANQSWQLFREMEDKGGFLRCIRSGYVHDQLEASRGVKLKAVATRKQVLIGTNQFPNPKEHVSADALPETTAAKLRAASAFEQVRIKNAERSPSDQKRVQLALLGSSPMSKARAGFAADLLAIGGFQSYRQQYATPEELPEKLLSNPDAALVLCASDDDLKTWLPAVNMLLQGKTEAPDLFVAAPETAIPEPELKAQLSGFINQGSNAVQFLSGLQEQNLAG